MSLLLAHRVETAMSAVPPLLGEELTRRRRKHKLRSSDKGESEKTGAPVVEVAVNDGER